MKRREIFSSIGSKLKKEEKTLIVRPPYFNKEQNFEKCKECEGFCINDCEEEIIKFDDNHTVIIDFSISGCTYCDECANSCIYDVLQLEEKRYINKKIEIDILKCLSWNQVMCFSCKDPCLDQAIDFLAMFRPSINDNCTSCGFCIKICPADAIKIGELNENN